jgi:hypothetical protein
VAEFQTQIADKCGINLDSQQFKIGFPPRALPVTDANMQLRAWGLKNGDSLIVEGTKSSDISNASATGPGAIRSDEPTMTEDEMLSLAIAASLEDAGPSRTSQSASDVVGTVPSSSQGLRSSPSVTNASADVLVAQCMRDGRYALL